MTSGAPPADTSQSGQCPFCAIVARLELASVVFADDHFVAFMDRRPVSGGHVVIATREHAHYLDEMAPAAGSTLYARIHFIRHALRSVGSADNEIRLLVSDGEPDNTTVAHVHAHVFPGRGASVVRRPRQDPPRRRDPILMRPRRNCHGHCATVQASQYPWARRYQDILPSSSRRILNPVSGNEDDRLGTSAYRAGARQNGACTLGAAPSMT
jgi:histidine triad (HIT) family protein